jgi:hypothetical protein
MYRHSWHLVHGWMVWEEDMTMTKKRKKCLSLNHVTENRLICKVSYWAKLQMWVYLGVYPGHKNRSTNRGMKSKGNPDQAGLTAKLYSLCLGAHVIPKMPFHKPCFINFSTNP